MQQKMLMNLFLTAVNSLKLLTQRIKYYMKIKVLEKL